MRHLKSICFLFALLTLCFSTKSYGQQNGANDDSEALVEALRSLLQSDGLSLGVLLQSQAEVHWDPQTRGANTFRVAAARFKVYGSLDDHFAYTLQADISHDQPLLDANVSYVSDRFALTAGAQKPGISASFLTSSSSTDFINRARVVSALVNRRDIGLKALLAITPSVYLTAGMFNGTNQKLENSNNTFYYTGRLVFDPDLGPEKMVKIGINAGRSIENGTLIGNGTLPPVVGDRTVYGGDLRLEWDRWLLSSELLLADLDYAQGISDDVSGFHITGGYWATENMQIVLRLDHLESDEIIIPNRNIILGGLNYNFTDAVSGQFNYQINPDDAGFSNQYWLAQLQVAL